MDDSILPLQLPGCQHQRGAAGDPSPPGRGAAELKSGVTQTVAATRANQKHPGLREAMLEEVNA